MLIKTKSKKKKKKENFLLIIQRKFQFAKVPLLPYNKVTKKAQMRNWISIIEHSLVILGHA